MDTLALETASVSELEALLSTSRAQQAELNQELDAFINGHIEELQSLFSDIDDNDVKASMVPLKDRYRILQTFEDVGRALTPLQQELATIETIRAEDKMVQAFGDSLAEVASSVLQTDLTAAYNQLESMKGALEAAERAGQLSKDHVTTLFDRFSDHQADVLREANNIWSRSVLVEARSAVIVRESSELIQAVDVLAKVGTLQGKARDLSDRILVEMIRPLLTTDARLTTNADRLLLGSDGKSGLAGLEVLLDFISSRLPGNVLAHMHLPLGSAMLHAIRDDYMSRAVPSEMQSTARLEALATSLAEFAKHLQSNKWLSTADLRESIEDIPRVWFENRRGVVLDQCRQIIVSWSGATEIVEQNENVTQESLLQPVADQKTSVPQRDAAPAKAVLPMNDDEDDAWGASEWEIPEEEQMQQDQNTTIEDDGTDAWGLDEDLMPEEVPATPSISTKEQTVVLSAKYTVSTIPKALLSVMNQCKGDAKSLQESSDSPVRSQAVTLLTLEMDILDLYKALVPFLITRTGYPRMTIYNDCIYLASQSDASIRTFGERFYTLEIHEKLDQIYVIMNRTDGFVSVTVSMQKDVCHAAIQGVLDVLTRTGERYEAQLGRTTLCTALGTLADAAIVYFVDSVMAMTDISEAESIELARLGDKLSTLEELFRGQEEGETILTAMWCPNWFRFRLLLDILEAKLDYILQLWTDRDLVDFEPGEVTELIRALFSDSPKRRNAIDQIMANV